MNARKLIPTIRASAAPTASSPPVVSSAGPPSPSSRSSTCDGSGASGPYRRATRHTSPRAANVRRTSPCVRPSVSRSPGRAFSGVCPKSANAMASSSDVLPAPVSPEMTTSSWGRRSSVARS